MTIEQNKQRFIKYELGLLSLKAALSTRGAGTPIYAANLRSHQRSDAKRALRSQLAKIERQYTASKLVSEEEHVAFIQTVAEDLTNEIGADLHSGRFRIGIAQKLVNIHLKYLWTAGFVAEPPHCPIDGIIRDLVGLDYEWTEDDDIDNYRSAIADLKTIAKAKDQSLAVWELEAFRRREDQ